MNDVVKFIFDNYTKARGFNEYWFAFENFIDIKFPHSVENDSFRARLERFEEYLQKVLVHETVWRIIYRLNIMRELAELQPRIFREQSKDTSAHDAFSSDYSRFARGQKPKQPLCRLLNLLYTVRCNAQHGQKPLPEEWEEIRKRNELVFAFTTPVMAKIDELIISLFVASGIFAYGTLLDAEKDRRFQFPVQKSPSIIKIKGHLYDLGDFPAWRYDTWGWVHGFVLRSPLQCRIKFINYCDDIEGKEFERRLTLAYENNEQPEHVVWTYHYRHEPDLNKRIAEGVWKGSNKLVQ